MIKSINQTDIPHIRLANQQISNHKFKSPKEVVSFMGAMQAQDYQMAKLALGARLSGFTEKDIEESFNRGEILRTHLMRPTWHFVSPDDIHWILELTSPNIKASVKKRDLDLGLTSEVLERCYKIIKKSLSGGKNMTKEELIGILEKEKLCSNSSQAYHIFLDAELDGIVCSGPMEGRKNTYCLLSERVPIKKTLSKDNSLAELARRYFRSHGPATIYDFVWWSGLSVGDARKAILLIKSEIKSEKIDYQEYHFSMAISKDMKKESLYLLPAFDEFLIGYRDRSHLIFDTHKSKAISSNGIFRPVIVLDGKVIGIWKRVKKKNKSIIKTQFFKSPDKRTMELLKIEVKNYGKFINQNTELN